MKKLSSSGCPWQTALSVVLAIALVAVSMPLAQAAQVELQAGGAVQQNVTSIEPPGVLLAHVTEGALDWEDDLGGDLNVFATILSSTSGKLEPGTNGSYSFTLHNAYNLGTKTIAYRFKLEVLQGKNVPIAYTVTRSSGAPLTLTGTPGQGLLAFDALTDVGPGGTVDFTLTWRWAYNDDGGDADPMGLKAAGVLAAGEAGYTKDNPLGVQARDTGPLKHEVLLEFYIEAAEPEDTVTLTWKDGATNKVYDTWPGLTPGMTIAEAAGHTKKAIPTPTRSGYVFAGFKDKNGVMIVNEKGEIVAPVGYAFMEDIELFAQWEKKENNWWPWIIGGGVTIGAGGLIVGGLTIPWLVAIPALPVLGLTAWLIGKNLPGGPKKPDAKPGPVTPPKTGESREMELLVGAVGLLAAGMLLTMLRRKKREGGTA
jgi:LPXTG-motif cell wall-anchored protein